MFNFKNLVFKFTKNFLIFLFFFTFWFGAISLWDLIIGHIESYSRQLFGAFIMAVLFSYFTKGGSTLGKFCNVVVK